MKNCLHLQNLQTFLVLEIIVEEIKVVVMEDNKIMILPSSTLQGLQKMGRDRRVRQFADSGNNAPSKKIYDVGWSLATFWRGMVVTMFLFEISCNIY